MSKKIIFLGPTAPFYICEGCDKVLPRSGWFNEPNGSHWVQAGRSRKMFMFRTKNHVVFSMWCPDCYKTAGYGPSEVEVQQLYSEELKKRL